MPQARMPTIATASRAIAAKRKIDVWESSVLGQSGHFITLDQRTCDVGAKRHAPKQRRQLSADGSVKLQNSKMPGGQFPANRPKEPKSQWDMASRPLPKSPVSSSPYDVVPQIIIRSPHVGSGKFAIGDAKSLLQQYRP